MGDTHKTAIITDSTCDIPQALSDELGIFVIPQHVIWGTEDMKDGVDIQPKGFYERLKREKQNPTTSQPPASEFIDYLNKAKENGAERALIITVSQELSGTNASALQAQQQIDMPVEVVDSRSVSMGLGWQVIAAARARNAGGDVTAMISAAQKAREQGTVLFYVDTLEYLHRGGRVSATRKLIGTMLNIKPQLIVDHTTGTIEAGPRTRTRSKAVEKLYEDFLAVMSKYSGKLRTVVLHADQHKDAEAFGDRLKTDCDVAELYVSWVSPVLGVHTGPGAIAFAGYIES
ncbi:MAG: DegV family protein [Chloroflexi bacterium]|nr:DegV family protein [Chloroflexota bacterium]